MSSIRDQYYKLLSDKICVSVEDLLDNEKVLIESSLELFMDKLEEINTLNKELYKLKIEYLNYKSMYS